MSLRHSLPVAALVSLLACPAALAFDSAKVLPKGVRNIDLRSVNTDISTKTDGSGKGVPLAKPLEQDLTFRKIANGEDPLKANQLRAFLTSNDFDEAESVGKFQADLNGHVSVFAPIASIGVSDRLTLALAVPYYRGSTAIAVGFQPNERAQAFLNALAKSENNQTAAAREAGDKMNNAVRELNQKLADNGFREIRDWEGQGVGDITLAAKYRYLDTTALASAATFGFVAPTGRIDDPNILNDLAFGDGQWDVFGQVALDEPIAGTDGELFFNQFAKYTAQMPATKTMRAVTDDEKIEVDTDDVRFKLGDKIDAGASVQWAPSFGLVSGLGYTYFKKYGDVYRSVALATKTEIEDETDQSAHNAEVMFGYSTLPAFQRGEFAAPVELKLTYTNQLASRHMPITDFLQLDFNLFF